MLKKIFSNTAAQLTAKFFGAGLTLITTYFTIRLAGLPLYGDLTKILVMVAVGFTAIDFGLNAEGIRSSRSEAEMQTTAQTIFLTRLLLSFLIIGILNLVIIYLPGGYSPIVKNIFWLGSLAILFQGVYTSCNSWFQYKLSYWRSTISVIVGSLLGTFLTLYWLRYSPTLSHLILANTLGYLSMAICSVLLLPPKFRSFGGLQRSERQIGTLRSILPLLRRSLILGFILIASVLASKIDTIILGIYRLSPEVGQYGFAYRIFDVILVLPVFVMNVIYPLSLQGNLQKSNSKLINQTTKIMAAIGILVAIILWFAAPLVNFVKPGMDLTATTLRLLAISLPLFYITAPLMWGLIGKKRDKLVLGIYLSAAILNTVLNLSFIPSYGSPAAAINTGLTEGFLLIALLYFSNKS
ncbi:MAG: oligosaccharide flippase family protein [Microgenomates group bacterium]